MWHINMKVINHREFANGQVFALKLDDGFLIETTDTFLPFYTKDASSQHSNALNKYCIGDRSERWMIGVSTMSGCPVKCKFCAAGKLKKWRNLSADEIVNQVTSMMIRNSIMPWESKEFKINYTRMGEPFLNLTNVKEAIRLIDKYYPQAKAHHYVSTIGLKGSDFSWIKDNITLQISLHSLDEERRKWLIPINNLMTLEELGAIRTGSNLKTTINLTLVDQKDFDIKKLRKYFDPKYFFVKLSPINENDISKGNDLGKGIIEQLNLV